MDLATQKGARGQHDRAGVPTAAILGHDANRSAVPHDQVVHGAGHDLEVRLLGEELADRGPIERAVGLGARPTHRRSLAAVQHPELDAGAIDRARHDAVKRIDLAHQMAASQAADRRVAGHRPDGLELVGEQDGARAHARARGRRLAAGVAAADDHDIAAGLTGPHGRCCGVAATARQCRDPRPKADAGGNRQSARIASWRARPGCGC